MSDKYERMLCAVPNSFEVAPTGDFAEGRFGNRYASVVQRNKNCFVVMVDGFSPLRCCDADSVSTLFRMVNELWTT